MSQKGSCLFVSWGEISYSNDEFSFANKILRDSDGGENQWTDARGRFMSSSELLTSE